MEGVFVCYDFRRKMLREFRRLQTMLLYSDSYTKQAGKIIIDGKDLQLCFSIAIP